LDSIRPIEYIMKYFTELTSTLSRVNTADIEGTIELLSESREQGRKIFMCGNGGSAATASHFACDLAKGTLGDGTKPFKVIPLTDNVPLITAWANDTDYSNIYSMQLEPLIEEGDVLIAISGSGKSANVLKAVETANLHGVQTVGITGFDGGTVRQLAGRSIHVDSFNMQHVEDIHMILVHMISSALRDLTHSTEKHSPLPLEVTL